MSIEGTAQTEYASLSGKIHTFVVDKTLSISGACADAKATGDRLDKLEPVVEEAKELYEEAVEGINDTAAQIAEEKAREAVNALTAADVGAYSKVENLGDAVKNTLGLSASAVPNDAFSILSRFHAGMGNEHIWKRTLTLSEGVEAGFNLGDVQTNAEIFRRPNSTDGVGWDVGSSLVVSDDGTVSIENKTSISPLLSNAGSKITGGYYYNFHTNSVLGVDAIYYIPNDATVSAKWDYSNDPDFGEYVVAVSKIQLVTGYPKIEAGTYVDYANSPDINAFTDGNGYTYTYLGQLGNKVQIATGSYTGTGSFNTSYPNSLTFDFVPKFLAVASIDVAYLGFCAPLATGQTIGVQVDGKNLFIATDATTVTWYSVYDASHQANTHSAQYYYLAIG